MIVTFLAFGFFLLVDNRVSFGWKSEIGFESLSLSLSLYMPFELAFAVGFELLSFAEAF